MKRKVKPLSARQRKTLFKILSQAKAFKAQQRGGTGKRKRRTRRTAAQRKE